MNIIIYQTQEIGDAVAHFRNRNETIIISVTFASSHILVGICQQYIPTLI